MTGKIAKERAKAQHARRNKNRAVEREAELRNRLNLVTVQRDELLAMLGTQAAKDVIAERHRQQTDEGWTPERDDQYVNRELSAAAECYAGATNKRSLCPAIWPWSPGWWKPSDYRRNLIKADALILAEIERIDRAALASAKEAA